MSHVIKLTYGNFEHEVTAGDVPVLVDYWAPWCGPCRTLRPIVEQIASERAGTLKVAKVDVDREPRLAERAGVHGIPTLVLYRDGRPVARVVGAQSKRVLERALGLDDGPDQAAA